MNTRIALLFCCFGLTARAEDPVRYGRDIRPILAENCFYCHGQDPNHRKADVRLDTADGQKETLTPGDPDASELVKRILSKDDGDVMPPPKSNRKLTEQQKQLLKRWVKEGAKFEGHWAFSAPKRPAVPKSGHSNPIDAFLHQKQQLTGLNFSPEADRVTLLRRITLDMIGLPPTPEETKAFLSDLKPDAYDRVVARLMQSPHYGERQVLPWLDAARYADSNGFQQEGDTFQWVWRDWVVRAINENMPFDQFTIEQLAGDLLPNATTQQKVATGFNRNHLVNGEGGAIPEEQRFNILFDRVDVTATNWLGLTMACAQCHDHKYDPMTMKDYYSLQAAFNNLSENGVAGRQSSKTRVSPPFMEVMTEGQEVALSILQKRVNDLKTQLSTKQRAWEKTVEADEKFPDKPIRELLLSKDPKTKADRDTKLKKHFVEKVEPKLAADLKAAEEAANTYRADEIPKVMVMADDKLRDTHILDRGEYLKKKEKVSFDTPAFLPPLPKDAPRNRLGFARWLVAPENPLMARVIVNRYWQNYFGVGLVKTSEDFGVQGDVPLHMDLLDWLAVEFRESGWDVKKLNRLIVTSQAYKQSSRVSAEQSAKDPENLYFARFPRLRLPSMILRDIALSASGLLDKRVGGKPVYPYQPDGIWEPLAITKERDFTYPGSQGADLYRRSLYTFWRRTVSPANMFDSANRQVCKVRASVTNTPLHALTTLNDVTWSEASRVLAAKLLKEEPDTDKRLSQAFRLILVREPKPRELTILKRILADQAAYFQANPKEAEKLRSVGAVAKETRLNAIDHAAWASVCLALFNTDEALTRE
jgi:hypothetical protein